VLAALSRLEFLKLQPELEQFDHKVSYFMADTADHREDVHAALAGLPFRTQTVFAHDEYLDVAPEAGTKGGAVLHLLDLWQIQRDRAVAAGDSGNGRQQLAHLSQRANVYFANKKHAAGVLEGLRALGFLRSDD
jgi:hydroxymethylpyrimidine pyrophosphatase-like HAD family hydrolase